MFESVLGILAIVGMVLVALKVKGLNQLDVILNFITDSFFFNLYSRVSELDGRFTNVVGENER